MSRPLRDGDTYCGWRVYDNGPTYHPVTGRWVAIRHGVRVGHNTGDGLKTMLDQRAADDRRRTATPPQHPGQTATTQEGT